MAESAALLVDEVLPREPMRQWLVSVPIPLRFLLVSRPVIMGHVLGIVYRVIACGWRIPIHAAIGVWISHSGATYRNGC